MSLKKSIEHEKEYRKPYYKSLSFDKTCRPHGGCHRCENNRMHRNRVAALTAREQIDEYFFDECG